MTHLISLVLAVSFHSTSSLLSMTHLIPCCFLLFVSLILALISSASISISTSISPISVLWRLSLSISHLLSLSHLIIILESQISTLSFLHSHQSSSFTLFSSSKLFNISITECPALSPSSSFYYSSSSQQSFSISFSTRHVLTLILQTRYLLLLL